MILSLTTMLKFAFVKFAVLGAIFLLLQITDVATHATGEPVPIHDVWFLLLVSWGVFSAITAGMPEPTVPKDGDIRPPKMTDSDGYLWAYRTMHILSQNGTSYFKNKTEFPKPPAA